MFPFRSFLYNFTLDNSHHVISAWQVGKKIVYWGPKHWIYFKGMESILCLYFYVTPVQIQCPSLHTLLLNCIPSLSICLFSYFRCFASNFRFCKIFFNEFSFGTTWGLEMLVKYANFVKIQSIVPDKLSITQTFFRFPYKVQVIGSRL